jgi:hypothetical protein
MMVIKESKRYVQPVLQALLVLEEHVLIALLVNTSQRHNKLAVWIVLRVHIKNYRVKLVVINVLLIDIMIRKVLLPI